MTFVSQSQMFTLACWPMRELDFDSTQWAFCRKFPSSVPPILFTSINLLDCNWISKSYLSVEDTSLTESSWSCPATPTSTKKNCLVKIKKSLIRFAKETKTLSSIVVGCSSAWSQRYYLRFKICITLMMVEIKISVTSKGLYRGAKYWLWFYHFYF